MPVDVISGKRRVTPANKEKFETGISLKGNLLKLFKLYVSLEEKDISYKGYSKQEILSEISKTKEKIKNKVVSKASLKNSEMLFKYKDLSLIHI